MTWECIEMSMYYSEKKQMRIKKADMRYKDWYERRKIKLAEVESVIEEVLMRVVYEAAEKLLRRKVLLELEEKLRKDEDRREREMSGLHMMRKRWHSRKGKYRKRKNKNITKPKNQEGQLLLEK